MTPEQSAVDYWRTRALAAEKIIRDMESMGAILPHDYQVLLERIRVLEEAACA